MLPSWESKSQPSVDEYELRPEYGNHETEADSNSAKSKRLIEDNH